MEKFYYVYILVNENPIDKRIYYIGSRGSKKSPEIDSYICSSNVVKKIIKENGNTFKKIITHICNSRLEAYEYESKLHELFNVDENELFYNLTKVHKKLYNYGKIYINGKQITTDEYYKSDFVYHTRNKINVKDENGNIYWVDINDERYIKKELKPIQYNMVNAFNIYKNKYEHITKEEFYQKKDNYIVNNTNKIIIKDENNKGILVDKNDPRILSGNYETINKGKIMAKDENGNVFYVDKNYFIENKLVGVNKDKVNGSDNPNAKIIHIFNKDHVLMFICNGNFKKICNENKLPRASLMKSYFKDGMPIYNSKFGITNAYKTNNDLYIGWYAKIIN